MTGGSDLDRQKIENAVRDILRGDVESGVITAERYEEITGEDYE